MMSAAVIFAGTHVSLTIIYAAWMISKAISEATGQPTPNTSSRSGE